MIPQVLLLFAAHLRKWQPSARNSALAIFRHSCYHVHESERRQLPGPRSIARPRQLNPENEGGTQMIRDICKDEAFLAQRAERATADDLAVAADLLETLAHHKDGCVGMAANMIGVNRRIIAFDNEGESILMFNPEIVKRSGPYEAEEGCLSLTGTRKARRWQSIKVRWQNEKFQERLKTFTGWTAQIIQHEIDHCEGIII